MTQALVSTFTIHKHREGFTEEVQDLLVSEEPLEIRLTASNNGIPQQQTVGVTMRTPGNDFELATGFLFTENVINNYQDIESIAYCESDSKLNNLENIVKVTLKPNIAVDLEKLKRNFYTGSSCGICGKASIEAVIASGATTNLKTYQVTAKEIQAMPLKMNVKQTVFKHTGGIHATALFNTAGELLCLREDVGRHNALDKLIGHQLIHGFSTSTNMVLLLSGRVSYELIQKAAIANIAIVCAIGAPSNLAVNMAQELGITLVGFLKPNGFNIYTHKHRILF